jgi:hypothetical protein
MQTPILLLVVDGQSIAAAEISGWQLRADESVKPTLSPESGPINTIGTSNHPLAPISITPHRAHKFRMLFSRRPQ